MAEQKHGLAPVRTRARRARVRLRLAPERRRALQRRLLAWYARNGRDLPWRRTRDPYRILVSEIMLQQTQVERVRVYYRRFLTRFPTIAALAAARPGEVREAWEGLGYYARSRNLHQAARTVVERHGGEVPRAPDAIRALPGVGAYTAGALRSFAFGEAAPILDTNAARVLQRFFGVRGDRRRGRVAARLWAVAAAVTPHDRAYDFNQGIMDLGATVCTSRAPRCPSCPLRRACSSAGRGAVLTARARTRGPSIALAPRR
jgi:A/G-specific adenine glycosylase